ncbi:carbamoyltransferase HypF [Celerinatantimonas yamalensis]|uniref:Carbamoyltransferase HypF n=1 Tax=Celerinatantimonas yamalensis TaxID=559956 RepID=A0ABW9GB07_9GAMM
MSQAIALRIQGTIQGVGFRPFVWQLAMRYGLKGDVCNDGLGVLVRLYPEPDMAAFVDDLHTQAPPLAQLSHVDWSRFRWNDPPAEFIIRPSQMAAMSTAIAADAATCPECLAELFNPSNHRYHYPLTTCTHCGPRFSVIEAMPYDRERTTLVDFPLCPRCANEYRAPHDRRFHGESTACPECGPKLHWWTETERIIAHPSDPDAPLDAAVTALKRGKIIALKGLGGFHLVCDASNQQAVMKLRQRKARVSKPLAVMVADQSGLTQLLEPTQITNAHYWLSSSAAPIVLADKACVCALASAVAPNLDEIGVIYPSNPLQHLLARALRRPLVLTSANRSGEAPPLDDEQAWQDLSHLADGLLGHNRRIVSRMDDSLLRLDGGQGLMMRRSRGFVPQAESLVEALGQSPCVLALGGDLKNTFGLLSHGQVTLSSHFGDLAVHSIEQQWQQAIEHYLQVYQCQPQHIVIDAHPGYASHRFGQRLAARWQVPVQRVFHHHAHVVAAMVEAKLSAAQSVVGICLDGLGMGEQGRLWGGECLVANYAHFEHIGGLPAVALPGGDQAATQPWRNLLAQWHSFVPDWSAHWPQALTDCPADALSRAIASGLNSPLASSTGRLFDAVAAYLGIHALQLDYEGQAAIILEQLARRAIDVRAQVSMPVYRAKNGKLQLDLAAFWRQWLVLDGSPAQRAWVFHDALAAGFAQMAKQIARERSIDTVVVCGGVMNNRLLRERFKFYLSDVNVVMAERFPSGDGALALGQAAVAAARLGAL